jgi:large subunit ribosomal protein L29
MAKENKSKADDYRSLDDQGLVHLIADEEMRMKKLQFSHAVNPIENPLSIRSLRRRIAQLKTEQRKRALGK